MRSNKHLVSILSSASCSSIRPTVTRVLPRNIPPSTSTSSSIPFSSRSHLNIHRYASTISSPRPSFSSSSSTRSQLKRPTTIVLIFVPIVCAFLGVWQVKRLRWKVALIDEVEKNLHREPMILPNHVNVEALPEFSFRRILLKGTLLPQSILLGPLVKEGAPGYALIQPLKRGNGASTILLNRGFITTTRANLIRTGQALPPNTTSNENGQGGDEIVVEGMLMRPGEQGFWKPDNNVKGNEWFWRDVEGMAEHMGGEEKGVQPVLIDVIDRGDTPISYLLQQGIPTGRPPRVELVNNHFQYAVTWFSLTAATTGMLAFVLTRGRRKPRMESRRIHEI